MPSSFDLFIITLITIIIGSGVYFLYDYKQIISGKRDIVDIERHKVKFVAQLKKIQTTLADNQAKFHEQVKSIQEEEALKNKKEQIWLNNKKGALDKLKPPESLIPGVSLPSPIVTDIIEESLPPKLSAAFSYLRLQQPLEWIRDPHGQLQKLKDIQHGMQSLYDILPEEVHYALLANPAPWIADPDKQFQRLRNVGDTIGDALSGVGNNITNAVTSVASSIGSAIGGLFGGGGRRPDSPRTRQRKHNVMVDLEARVCRGENLTLAEKLSHPYLFFPHIDVRCTDNGRMRKAALDIKKYKEDLIRSELKPIKELYFQDRQERWQEFHDRHYDPSNVS